MTRQSAAIRPGLASPAKVGNSSSEQLLLTAYEAAGICSVSVRNWRIWDSAGKVPRPIRIGRARLWRLAELHAWVAASCPRREAWENMQLNAVLHYRRN
jgi:predicted DNA-binding transcriptional regulator AlpA